MIKRADYGEIAAAARAHVVAVGVADMRAIVPGGGARAQEVRSVAARALRRTGSEIVGGGVPIVEVWHNVFARKDVAERLRAAVDVTTAVPS